MTRDPIETAADSQQSRRALDRSLVLGVIWSGAGRWGAQIVTWLTTLVVARLLTPADYGLVALATLYFGFVSLLTEFGIGSAIVTMRTLSAHHFGQLNSLAVALSACAAVLAVGVATPMSAFFNEPALARIMPVLAVGAFLSGVRIVPSALLRKDLQFRKLAAFEASQMIAAAFGTIGLAVAGWGYWALVGGNVLGSAAHALLIVHARPERFLRPRLADVRDAMKFSRDILTSRLSWYLYENADFMVVGRLLGASLLGAYKMAWTFASLPIEKVVSVVGFVTPAVLAAVREDRRELRRYVLRITEGTGLIIFPAGVGLALVAEEFVQVLLGEKWLAAVGPLRILSAYAAVRGLAPVWSQMLLVMGETKFLMRVSAVGAIVLPLGFLAASPWGLVGIAFAWLAVHPVVIVIPILGRVLDRVGLSLREYARVVAPIACATLVMACAVVIAQRAVAEQAPAGRLAAQVAVGVGCYLAAICFLARERVRAVLRTLAAGKLE